MNNPKVISLLCIITLQLSTVFSSQVNFDNLTFTLRDLESIEENSWFNEDKPEKCYFRLLNRYWNVGEQWAAPDQCWIARCNKPGQVIILNCGVVEPVEDGYTDRYCHQIGMDFSRPYPGCCPRFMCRSFNDSTPYIYNPLIPGGGKERPYYKRWMF